MRLLVVSSGIAGEVFICYPLPSVPLPPSFILPKRRKGTDSVTMSGVTWRITMTFSGLDGMSLLVMVVGLNLFLNCSKDWKEESVWMYKCLSF